MNEYVSIYEDINRKTYADKKNVVRYSYYQELTPGERAIIDQYRDDIENKTILDIGCGAGRTARFLKKLGKDYTGIDYSEAAVNYCREIHGDARFLHCDARQLDRFGSGEFDVVFFPCNGIDSMDSQGRQRAISEVFRVVKEGGLFVFATHNHKYLMESWKGRTPFPRPALSTRPKKMINNLKKFTRASFNYLKNRKHVYIGEQDAIVQGVAYDYDLMTYYIDKRKQIIDLETVGFTVERMYDRAGQVVDRNSSHDGHTPWIFYVARKPVSTCEDADPGMIVKHAPAIDSDDFRNRGLSARLGRENVPVRNVNEV